MAGTIIVDRIESDASYASTINVAGQITFSNTVNFGVFAGTAPVAGFYLPTTNALAFTTASTERMRIDSSGNVGIGTSSPTSLLHVSSTTANPQIKITDLSIAGGRGGSIQGSYSGNGLYLDSLAAAGWVYIGSSTGGGQATNIRFDTSNTERMRIDSSGNVGIGLTNPSIRLDVVGASAASAVMIKPQGSLPNNNDNAGLYVLHQGTGGTAFRVRTDNAVSASYFAHILVNNASAAATALQVDQYGTGNIVDFTKSGTVALRIDNAGRVTMPYQPYLHATVGSGTTAINFGTTHANVTVPYNTIFTNTGNHFNTSTSTFTCPVAGIYLVYATIQLGQAAGVSGVGPNMQVTRSGAAITGSYHFVLTGNGYQKMECTGYVKCAANDTLSITLYTGSAMTGGSTEFNGDSRNALCIAYIG